jgi:hypothetical protein
LGQVLQRRVDQILVIACPKNFKLLSMHTKKVQAGLPVDGAENYQSATSAQTGEAKIQSGLCSGSHYGYVQTSSIICRQNCLTNICGPAFANPYRDWHLVQTEIITPDEEYLPWLKTRRQSRDNDPKRTIANDQHCVVFSNASAFNRFEAYRYRFQQ